MDKKKAGSLLFWLGAGALLAGAGTYFYQQYLLTEYLCYTPKKLRVNKFSLTATQLELLIDIENKGALDIELAKMTFDVYANGTYVAQINQNVQVGIKPQGKTELPLVINFSPKQVLGSVLNILNASTLNDISFRFKGKAVVKKWGIPIPVPFDFSYTVAEMKQPSPTSVCGSDQK